MFHPLRGLQFAEPLLFFSIIVVPASRAGLGALEYGLLMVRDDTNHGNKTMLVSHQTAKQLNRPQPLLVLSTTSVYR